jgi:hypothetical protein
LLPDLANFTDTGTVVSQRTVTVTPASVADMTSSAGDPGIANLSMVANIFDAEFVAAPALGRAASPLVVGQAFQDSADITAAPVRATPASLAAPSPDGAGYAASPFVHAELPFAQSEIGSQAVATDAMISADDQALLAALADWTESGDDGAALAQLEIPGSARYRGSISPRTPAAEYSAGPSVLDDAWEWLLAGPKKNKENDPAA